MCRMQRQVNLLHHHSTSHKDILPLLVLSFHYHKLISFWIPLFYSLCYTQVDWFCETSCTYSYIMFLSILRFILSSYGLSNYDHLRLLLPVDYCHSRHTSSCQPVPGRCLGSGLYSGRSSDGQAATALWRCRTGSLPRRVEQWSQCTAWAADGVAIPTQTCCV